MSEGVYGLIGTLFGGVLLAVSQAVIAARKGSQDEGYNIRQDQRKDIADLKSQVQQLLAGQDEMRKELDTWKDKYYVVVKEDNELRGQYTALREEHEELKKDHERLKVRNSTLEDEVTHLQKEVTANKAVSVDRDSEVKIL